jgi:hypothetical protein
VQVEPDLIDVAPPPSFRRIVTLDDWMPGAVEMLGGMPSRRLIATTDVAAVPANSQMYPSGSGLETLLAAPSAGFDLHYRAEVRTMSSHTNLLCHLADLVTMAATRHRKDGVVLTDTDSTLIDRSRFGP